MFHYKARAHFFWILIELDDKVIVKHFSPTHFDSSICLFELYQIEFCKLMNFSRYVNVSFVVIRNNKKVKADLPIIVYTSEQIKIISFHLFKIVITIKLLSSNLRPPLSALQ